MVQLIGAVSGVAAGGGPTNRPWMKSVGVGQNPEMAKDELPPDDLTNGFFAASVQGWESHEYYKVDVQFSVDPDSGIKAIINIERGWTVQARDGYLKTRRTTDPVNTVSDLDIHMNSLSNAELHALRKAIDQKRREVGGVEAVVLDQLSMEAEREEIDREEQAERDKRREEKKHKNAK